MQNTFTEYQYDDLIKRENDPYAKAKYSLLLGYLKKSGRSGLRILNAGCGSGELSVLLSRAGHKVIGIDPSEEYTDLAQKRAISENVNNCEFRVGSIEDLPEDEKYDCVIATDVLEHIEADYTAMNKLAKVVVEGGLIFITVPALEALYGYHDEMIGHYRRYTKKTLKRLVESPRNTRIFALRYFGFTLIPICYLFSCVLRRTYPFGSGKQSLKAKIQNLILAGLLYVDKRLPMPLGISLICAAERLPDCQLER